MVESSLDVVDLGKSLYGELEHASSLHACSFRRLSMNPHERKLLGEPAYVNRFHVFVI